MTDSTTAAPAVSVSGEPASAPVDAAEPIDTRAASPAEVAAHGLAAFILGAVSLYLADQTSPAVWFGVVEAPVAPELAALLALALGLIPGLSRLGWLLAAVGLFGIAVLYAQGTRLDGAALLVAMIAVAALQFGGLLHAFGAAGGPSRRALGIGFAAGIGGGYFLLGIIARAAHNDAALFAVLGVLVAAAGAVLLLVRRAPDRAAQPVAWWSLGAVLAGSVLATAATWGWGAALDRISMRYIGGISEADAVRIQTWDQAARVTGALLVAAALAGAAHRWGPRGAARWVAVGFSLALAGFGVNYVFGYTPAWTGVLAGVIGAAAGVPLAATLARSVPWDAVGLVLATGLLVLDPPSALSVVGWFGLGLAASVALSRLASAGARGAGGGLGVGVAALLLCYQVVEPAANLSHPDRETAVPVLAIGVLLGAAGAAVAFLADRRNTTA